MIITNKTSVTLKIPGGKLQPNQTREYNEMIINTLNIRSEIGNCIIRTEYDERIFECYGKLVAKEGNKIDKNGMKNIIIYSIE